MTERPPVEPFYDGDGVAHSYSRHRHSGPSPNHVMEEPAFLAAVGDLGGLAVLDLGCGDAHFGLVALQAGARSYLGVDNSRAMLEQARQVLTGTEAHVQHSSIEELQLPDGTFDLIVSRMALHHVEDLDSVLSACRRWVVPSGRVVFTVLHPVLTSPISVPPSTERRTDWTVDDYFSTGARQRSWMGSRVTWYHRTLENYVTSLAANGFALSQLRECAPEPQRFVDADDPELARRRRVPMFLLLAAAAT
ncbi:class I SAM-dependent methyltransferase [Kineococcus sp. NPDC059986]|uniref:class I SAM-dependent methyltransferase n=1 Tax=Kineococcus sp. NPDC059986 TaxID=3155538 RepID=UPI00344D54DB